MYEYDLCTVWDRQRSCQAEFVARHRRCVNRGYLRFARPRSDGVRDFLVDKKQEDDNIRSSDRKPAFREGRGNVQPIASHKPHGSQSIECLRMCGFYCLKQFASLPFVVENVRLAMPPIRWNMARATTIGHDSWSLALHLPCNHKLKCSAIISSQPRPTPMQPTCNRFYSNAMKSRFLQRILQRCRNEWPPSANAYYKLHRISMSKWVGFPCIQNTEHFKHYPLLFHRTRIRILKAAVCTPAHKQLHTAMPKLFPYLIIYRTTEICTQINEKSARRFQ